METKAGTSVFIINEFNCAYTVNHLYVVQEISILFFGCPTTDLLQLACNDRSGFFMYSSFLSDADDMKVCVCI